MAQLGKQMRVCACEVFAYDSVKPVILANGSRYEVDGNTIFVSDKDFYSFKVLPCPKSDLFDTFVSVVCALWFQAQYDRAAWPSSGFGCRGEVNPFFSLSFIFLFI